jgi:hypothetical protein
MDNRILASYFYKRQVIFVFDEEFELLLEPDLVGFDIGLFHPLLYFEFAILILFCQSEIYQISQIFIFARKVIFGEKRGK